MIGVGVDLVDIDRLRVVLARTPGVADRMFTTAERAYAAEAVDGTARLAARFAAKEAALKCLGLGLGGMPLGEIEVVRDGSTGRPGLQLHGKAAKVAAEHSVAGWHVSLSHTDALAEAVVVAL